LLTFEYNNIAINVYNLNSQGSVATDLRQRGSLYNGLFCSLRQNAAVNALLKSVHICQNYYV